MEEVSYLENDKDQEVKFQVPAYNNNEMPQITHNSIVYVRSCDALR